MKYLFSAIMSKCSDCNMICNSFLKRAASSRWNPSGLRSSLEKIKLGRSHMGRSRPSTRPLLGRRRKKLQRHHQRGVFTVNVFCLWPFDNVFPLKGLPDQSQHTLQTTFPSLRTLMPPSTGSLSLWWTSNMNQKTLRAGISLHRSGIHPSKRQSALI